MIDLDDRLRSHLAELRDGARPAPGDLTAVPARAARHRRAQRRRALLASTAAVAVLGMGVGVLAVRDGGGSDESVTADEPPVALDVAFEPVAGPSGVRPGHFLHLVDSGEGVAALSMGDDDLPVVWTTGDGATWERMPVDGVDGGDMFGGYLERDGWRVAWGDDAGPGPGSGTQRIAMAWTSRDGGPWVAAHLEGGDGPDSGPSIGFRADDGVALLGYRTDLGAAPVDLPGGRQPWPQLLAWTTADGVTWTRHEVDRAQFGADAEFGPVLDDGEGAVLQVLHRSDGHASYWRTTDGVSWVQLGGDLFGAGAQLDAIGPAATGRLAIGTVGEPIARPPGTVGSDERGHPALWSSSDDGHSWSALSSPLPETGRYRSFTTAAGVTAVLHTTTTEHVHDAGDPDRALSTDHSRIGILLLERDGRRSDVDLSTALGLDPHVHATAIHTVGDRLLLELTRVPTSIDGGDVSTELWLGTIGSGHR